MAEAALLEKPIATETAESQKVYEGPKKMRKFNEKGGNGEYPIVRLHLADSFQGKNDALIFAFRNWHGTDDGEAKWINSKYDIPPEQYDVRDYAVVRLVERPGNTPLLLIDDGEKEACVTDDDLEDNPDLIVLDAEKKQGIILHKWDPQTRQVDIQRGWIEPKTAAPEKRSLVDIIPPIIAATTTLHGSPSEPATPTPITDLPTPPPYVQEQPLPNYGIGIPPEDPKIPEPVLTPITPPQDISKNVHPPAGTPPNEKDMSKAAILPKTPATGEGYGTTQAGKIQRAAEALADRVALHLKSTP